MLTIGAYEHQETCANGHIARSWFEPRSFPGWPIQPKCNADVAQWIDHNVEKETASLYAPGAEHRKIGYRNGTFSELERDLIAGVRNQVAGFCSRAFGKPYKPLTALLVQIGPYRVMRQLAMALDWMPTVFEIGPGNGYLGALLAHSGFRYTGTDCLPALYIWQNWLWETIAGDDFADLAERIEGKRVMHLPWWHWAGDLGIPCDVVYANAVLSEMDQRALRFALNAASLQLSGSKLGLLCFFTHGAPYAADADEVDKVILEAGFHRVAGVPFEAFVIDPKRAEFVQDTFRHGIESSGNLDANTVMALKREEAPPDIEQAKEISGFEPPFIN